MKSEGGDNMSWVAKCKTCKGEYDATNGDLSKCPLCGSPTLMTLTEFFDSLHIKLPFNWEEDK